MPSGTRQRHPRVRGHSQAGVASPERAAADRSAIAPCGARRAGCSRVLGLAPQATRCRPFGAHPHPAFSEERPGLRRPAADPTAPDWPFRSACRTPQGNSQEALALLESDPPRTSQSLRTAQGNSKTASRVSSQRGGKAVAIPPYCSGQFQGSLVFANLTAPNGPQSHRTAQGNSKLRPFKWGYRSPAPTQSHRTAEGNSKVAKQNSSSTVSPLVAIPPYCSGQFQGSSGSSSRGRARNVAIPPYCSGQFQGSSGSSSRGRARNVAIPPYCSGQFQGRSVP